MLKTDARKTFKKNGKMNSFDSPYFEQIVEESDESSSHSSIEDVNVAELDKEGNEQRRSSFAAKDKNALLAMPSTGL